MKDKIYSEQDNTMRSSDFRNNNSKSRSKHFPYINILIPGGFRYQIQDLLWQSKILGLETLSEDEYVEIIRVYFENCADLEAGRETLSMFVKEAYEIGSGEVEYGDWESFLHGGFEPLQVGELIVVPLENPPPIPAGKKPLRIVPGRGFGTGSHPTTRLSLEYLVECLKPGISMLDVGTGSGILAIAAILSGAESAFAVDTDLDSLENAVENAEINGVLDNIRFEHGSLEIVNGHQYDLVIANVVGEILKRFFAEGLSELVQPGGILILSGILKKEVDQILAIAGRTGFIEKSCRSIGEWNALLFQKEN